MTRVRRLRVLALAATVAVAPLACAQLRALGPRPWDAYANEGRLRVHGAPADAPGPRVYRALAARAEVRDVLAHEGEPDALEIIGRRGNAKRIVLLYWRRAAGRPRRIVLEETRAGLVASAPQPLRRTRKVARGERRPLDDGGAIEAEGADAATQLDDASARPQPNARQRFECPIDRDRPDCRAYCDAGAGISYEWCR